MKAVLAVLALLMVTVTALPLLRFDHWWIRIFDFPRFQLALAGACLVPVYLYLYFRQSPHTWELIVFGSLLLAVGYQAVKIFPYTMLMPKQVLTAQAHTDEPTISLLVANVMMENREVRAFLGLVRDYDPDVILTVETDAWWEQALRSLDEAYPYTLKCQLDNTYGMQVHSRLEMVDPEIRFILKDDVPSMHMQVILSSGQPVFMHFVHPDPPNPKYAVETTKRDAELLIVGREVGKRDKPSIIAGDLNDVPWSATTRLFQKSSGLLDPRVGRGMFSTFDARNPLLRWPLDHVFHSNHFNLVQMMTGPAWGSDHLPLFVELSLVPGAALAQDEMETDQAEEEQVDEKIDDGKQQANKLG